MKSLITLIALFSLNAFAEAPIASATNDNFAERKTQALANIDKRIAMMNEMKTCISGASDQAALKTCHQKMREEHKGMKMDRMDHKIQKMQERKAKIAK